MKKIRLITLLLSGWLPLAALADIEPKVTYTDKEGEKTEWQNVIAEAPLHVRFTSNPSGQEPGTSIEWSIKNKNTGTSVTRHEEDTEYTFTESGLHDITVTEWLNNEAITTMAITITIAESHLEMPNAFSPNDDGHNDYYGAKGIKKNEANSSGAYKSIVEFHAWIFNRWGQKLYEWTDIEGYWDGKYNGSPVKDGVYFVVVKARGADGIEYNIRRDVNLIRNHNNETSTGGGSNEQ